jgi:hypothetical protein
MSAAAVSAVPEERILGTFRRPSSMTEARLIACGAAVAALAIAMSATLPSGTVGLVVGSALLPLVALTVPRDSRIFVATLGGPVFAVIFSMVRFLPIAAAGALLAALVCSWIERRRGLRRAALAGAIRDFLWRSIGIVAAVLAAVDAGNRTERAVFEAAYNAPLEGLALSAGVLVFALGSVLLAAAVWSLPRIAAKRQNAGLALPADAADVLWLGVFLLAMAVAVDIRAVVARGIFSDALAHQIWHSLIATFAFAAARLGLSVSAGAEVQPLWILVAGGRTAPRSLFDHAAVLAARWSNGPVTVVAAPEAALRCGGAHLRLAQMLGDVEPLFPQKAIHLADWQDTLPPRDRWQALPIRELYVADDLLPAVFKSRLESNARIVVIGQKQPDARAVDRLRAFLPTNRTDFHLPFPEGSTMFERWPGVGIYPIVGQGVPTIELWIARNAIAPDRVAAPRWLLIAYPMRYGALGEQLAAALSGTRDRRGKEVVVEAALVVEPPLLWSRLRRSTHWRRVMKQSRDTNRNRWWALIEDVFARVVSRGPIDGTIFDLLVIEGDQAIVTQANLDDVVEERVAKLADRVIAVLPSHQPAPYLKIYTDVLRLPALDVTAPVPWIVQHYLAADFEPVVETAEPAFPSDPRLPRVCLSFPTEYEDIARQLEDRLPSLHETRFIPPGQLHPEELRPNDLVIAFLGQATLRSGTVINNLGVASLLSTAIVSVIVGDFDRRWFPRIQPMNIDFHGTILDLREGAKDLDRAFRVTVENVVEALGRPER